MERPSRLPPFGVVDALNVNPWQRNRTLATVSPGTAARSLCSRLIKRFESIQRGLAVGTWTLF